MKKTSRKNSRDTVPLKASRKRLKEANSFQGHLWPYRESLEHWLSRGSFKDYLWASWISHKLLRWSIAVKSLWRGPHIFFCRHIRVHPPPQPSRQVWLATFAAGTSCLAKKSPEEGGQDLNKTTEKNLSLFLYPLVVARGCSTERSHRGFSFRN